MKRYACRLRIDKNGAIDRLNANNNKILFADYMRQSGAPNYPPRSGYDELDTTLMPPRPGEQYAGGGGGGQQPHPPQQGGPGG